jgi:hypothetical protein
MIRLKTTSKSASKIADFVQGVAFVSATGAALVALSTSAAQAATISNGSLTVDIRNDNGTINSLTFGGSEFYRRGTFISDFGFQNGNNTSTFAINDAFGSVGQPVSVSSSGGFVSVTGQYTKGGAALDFTRIYSLVPGQNVLRVATNFFNKGQNTSLKYFDTYDPDQGIDKGTGFGTDNDVYSLATGLGTAKVGQATESTGLSVVIGSLDPNATIASGSPFNIGNGFALNNFFNSPFDGNGAFADEGTHIGVQKLLTTGSGLTFTYDQAFGTSPKQAQQQFIAANTVNGSTSVPEPLTILGSATALGFGAVLKKKSAKKENQEKATA